MEPQQTNNEVIEIINIPPQPPKSKVEYLIPLSIVIAGALIAGGIYFSNSKISNQSGDTNGNPTAIKISPITKDDHIIGDPKAKIVIVEYSDLECPFCKSFHSTLHQIIDKYGKDNQVAWVYRHFPLTEIHPKAPKEAEASECAFEQGGNDKFWQFIDAVYKVTPSNNKLESSELPKIAGEIGLDVNKFNTCLSSGKYADKVAAGRADAIKAGGQGTPYTILVTKKGNTPITRGAVSFEELSGMIDQLLAGK